MITKVLKRLTPLVQFIFFLILISLVASCATGPIFTYTEYTTKPVFPSYPDAYFAIVSDTHFYKRSLGLTGPDFRGELASGKKMLDISQEINEELVRKLIDDREIKFVLVCGDLTKDGELENHLAIKDLLALIEATGKQVYVVPGNHDINNYNACRYTARGSEKIASVTSTEFMEIYSAFGYSEAVSKDPASCSYVAEPVPGLWLFAMDSCTYYLNSSRYPSSTAGRFKPETLAWIEAELAQAVKQNKAVMGMLHHGIVEHFTSQKKYFRDFVLDDWEAVSRLFAHYGMRLVFTGHFHAQDITMRTWPDKTFLLDIETSSMITFPCAWRTVAIAGNNARVTSYPLTSIPSVSDFQTYAKNQLLAGVDKFISGYMKRYNFTEQDSRIISPQLARGLMAHTTGDEVAPAVLVNTEGLSLGATITIGFANDLIEGAWHDLVPVDNNILLDLATGRWSKP
ncbi:MAG: metallophosphoesterase [Spirochaetaceae bacterium]|nr:MAG: metallophosphoesterase [Spirochaetaceae bacterium]